MKRLISISAMVLIALLLVTCKGSYPDKIIGLWRQVPYIDPENVTTTKYWQFFAGSTLVIYTYDNSNNPVDSIEYSYYIDKSTLDILDGPGDPIGYSPGAGDPRGQYWVDQLNKEYLKATKRKHPDGSTEAAYLRIEFVKAD